jgi:hypothetical protein
MIRTKRIPYYLTMHVSQRAILVLFCCVLIVGSPVSGDLLNRPMTPAAGDGDTFSACGVWFAESTIPGAGFGVFAGMDYKPGDQITPGDLVVPYLDMAWHNGVEDDDLLAFLWNEYVWLANEK